MCSTFVPRSVACSKEDDELSVLPLVSLLLLFIRDSLIESESFLLLTGLDVVVAVDDWNNEDGNEDNADDNDDDDDDTISFDEQEEEEECCCCCCYRSVFPVLVVDSSSPLLLWSSSSSLLLSSVLVYSMTNSLNKFHSFVFTTAIHHLHLPLFLPQHRQYQS